MKQRVNITIPEELLKEVDELCYHSGYTRSFIIMRALKRYIKELEEMEEQQ